MAAATNGDLVAPTAAPAPPESPVETALLLALNAVFVVAGLIYSLRVLAPKPMTYLSEIAFPADFCVKMAASSLLFLLHAVLWLYNEVCSSWYLLSQPSNELQRSILLMMETLVWGMSSVLLWMEYRRGLTPSTLLRGLWVIKWVLGSYFLVTHQQTWLALQRSTTNTLNPSWSLAEVFGGICYAATGLLALMCFGTSTPISPEFISFPMAVNTPSAYLASPHRRPPVSQYGSFQDYVHVNHLGDASMPDDAALVLKDDDEPDEERSTLSSIYTIEVSIPASTTTTWGHEQFVSYKIIVQTDDDVWTVRRQHCEFVGLFEELPEEVQSDCPLPPDESDESGEPKFLSWRHRPRPLKARLEAFLRQVVNHPLVEPYRCIGLCDFLEMEYLPEPFPGSYRSAPRSK